MGRATGPRPEVTAYLAMGEARENLRRERARYAEAVALAGGNPTPATFAACDRTANDITRAAEVLRSKWLAWGCVVGIVELPGGETVAA